MSKLWLVLFSFAFLAACNDKTDGGSAQPAPQSTDSKSVAEFIHDLDSAKSVIQDAKKDAEKAKSQAAQNASQALAKSMSPSLLECWPTKPASTATTDHACLDQHGFKR